MAGLATVATIQAAHNVDQNLKRRDERKQGSAGVRSEELSHPDADSGPPEPTIVPPRPQSRSIEQRFAEYFLPPNPESPRIGYTDGGLQQISGLLRNTGRVTWSTVPRIYTVSRLIGQLELIEKFRGDGITDFWFPFTK